MGHCSNPKDTVYDTSKPLPQIKQTVILRGIDYQIVLVKYLIMDHTIKFPLIVNLSFLFKLINSQGLLLSLWQI